MADVIRLHPERAPLWREVLGRSLRSAREEQGSRLIDVAERAGISPQYLSEIERGRKDPSSEMIEAVAGALGMDLPDVLRRSYSAQTSTTARPTLLLAA